MKKYLTDTVTVTVMTLLSSLFATAHAHSGHFHAMGYLHTHASNEIALLAIVVLAGAYYLVKR